MFYLIVHLRQSRVLGGDSGRWNLAPEVSQTPMTQAQRSSERQFFSESPSFLRFYTVFARYFARFLLFPILEPSKLYPILH